MFENLASIALVALGIVVVFGVIMATLSWIARRYVTVPPNQVLVVYGRRHKMSDPSAPEKVVEVGFRIVKGGGTVVLPVVEKTQTLDLSLFTMDVGVENVLTKSGVAVSVNAVCQAKIGGDDNSIYTAAEQFLGKSQPDIDRLATQTMEGHLRAILSTMEVEQIYQDRTAFAQQVQAVATEDMGGMGFTIVSFTIRDISDKQGYLNSLGVARTAQVKRDADVGKAEAEREAAVKVAQANQAAKTAQINAEIAIANTEKEKALRIAAIKLETGKAEAEAAQAFALQTQISMRAVTEAQVGVEIARTLKAQELAQAEAERKQKELDATVRAPASAEAFRLETIAAATRKQAIMTAEGESEAARQRGQGDADAAKSIGLAEAEANKAKGLAQSEVILAQGTSEAEALRLKAAALAAQENVNLQLQVVQMLIDGQVKIAGTLATALAGIGGSMKVVQIGGASGADGIGGTNPLFQALKEIPELVTLFNAKSQALGGQDVETLLTRAAQILGASRNAVASNKVDTETKTDGV